MNSVVITGAAGFIGSHLAESYLKDGFHVFGLDNFITGSRENAEYLLKKYPDDFYFYENDITEAWPELHPTQLRYVFHLASPAAVKLYQKYPLETMRANSVGLQNALSFADQYQARLIFSSTSEIYGTPLSSPQKESDWGHVNSYGERSCYDESKRFGESLIFSYNKIYNCSHGIVRIFNTYGPRMHEDDDRVINSFVRQALNNEDLLVYGDGLQTRSFCYIEDLITGLKKYAQFELHKPMNLGSSEEVTILNLARMIIQVSGSTSNIRFEKLPVDDPPVRRPDLSAAKDLLNYAPSNSLQEGIKKMLAHLRG